MPTNKKTNPSDLKFSIIIPCYNESAALPKLLGDLSKQKRHIGEVIVVDNNSTDDSKAKVAKFKTKLPIVMLTESKQGIAFARNKGLAHAKEDYIIFTDADTRLPVGILDNLYEELLDKKLDLAAFLQAVEEKNPLVRLGVGLFNVYIKVMSYTPWPIGIGGCLACRRSLCQKLGGFDTTLFVMEDYDIILRAKRSGAKVGISNSGRPIVSLRRFQGKDGLKNTLNGFYGELYRYTHGLRVEKRIYGYHAHRKDK